MKDELPIDEVLDIAERHIEWLKARHPDENDQLDMAQIFERIVKHIRNGDMK